MQMDDHVLSLAETLVNIPGSTALLLGSGVSSAAGIPTGWNIMLDLIQQITVMMKVDPVPSDFEAWYRVTFETTPTYDSLVEKLAPTSTDRAQLLKHYFEPTEEERTGNLKMPTPAHHAIARLVSQGAIKAILTTNFDHLLEQALQAEGIEPTVVYTPDMIEGMLPLSHILSGHCTVIKLHGDYLDARLKNTTEELAVYDDRVNRLLDQILDEYGLLVCGWSGAWDQALRDAISRRKSRRFSFYWTTREPLTEPSADLARQQGAVELSISNANSFFRDLEERVTALRTMRMRSQPLTAQVAAETVKRYLPDNRNFIRLDDLLAQETEHAFAQCTEPDTTGAGGELGEAIELRLARYESLCDVLLAMYVAGGAYATPEQAEPWVRSLARMSNPGWLHNRPWPHTLALYPGLLLLYCAGLAAVARENFGFLAALLYNVEMQDDAPNSEMDSPLGLALDVLQALNGDEAKKMPSQLNHHTPLSDHLHACLREPLRLLMPNDRTYDTTFDYLEYLLALVHTSLAAQYKDVPAAPGRYIWHSKPSLWVTVPTEIEKDRENWKPLKGGLFPGLSPEQLSGIADELRKWDNTIRQGMW